ncbi:MAG TPA: hypothetical protein DCZ69_07150 [Syntrophobacteraceae bacterium]|nr:hypothetical protein [Syntrophobacteraceae bacterium]
MDRANHIHKRLSIVIDLLLKGSAFDVCQDLQLGKVFFIYEIYTDEDAFKKHLSSRHFKEFDIAIREWVERKSIRKLKRTFR